MLTSRQSFVIFSILVAQSLATEKPTMTPAGPVIEVTAGHPLELTCKSSKPMKFIQPPPITLGTIKPTKAEEMGTAVGMHSWTHTLRKPSPDIADTGFYGCANDDVDVDESRHDQSDVTWIQVIISNL